MAGSPVGMPITQKVLQLICRKISAKKSTFRWRAGRRRLRKYQQHRRRNTPPRARYEGVLTSGKPSLLSSGIEAKGKDRANYKSALSGAFSLGNSTRWPVHVNLIFKQPGTRPVFAKACRTDFAADGHYAITAAADTTVQLIARRAAYEYVGLTLRATARKLLPLFQRMSAPGRYQTRRR